MTGRRGPSRIAGALAIAALLTAPARLVHAQSDPGGAPPTLSEADDLPGPPQRPSQSRGHALYERECRGCHGADGVAPANGQLGGAPRPSLVDPQWRREQTPADVFAAIRNGPSHQSAPRPRLGVQEAWDATTYVWALGRAVAEVDEGRRLFSLHCADCHGAAGDGIGAAIEERPPSWSDFSLAGTLATDSDTDLEGVIAHGLPEFGMPPFEDRLTVEQRWTLVGFLRALPFAEVYLASGAGRSASWRSPRLGPSGDHDADGGSRLVWIAAVLLLASVAVIVVRRRR